MGRGLRTKTAVLLGAGASRDAGVPMTTEMTQRLYELTHTSEFFNHDAARIRRALGTVIGGLLFQRGTRGGNPYEGLDVEEVFATVQMLANRNNIEAAPFIGSWHNAIDELEERPSSNEEFDSLYRAIRNGIAQEVKRTIRTSSPFRGIQRAYDRQVKRKNPQLEWGKWISDALLEPL